MPTISKEHIAFVRKSGATQFLREIKVDSSGEFTIALPEEVTEAIGLNKIKASTKDDAINQFRKAIDDYNATKSTTKRVICYRIKITARIWSADRVVLSQDDVHFGEGTILALVASVYDETTTIDAAGRARYNYERIKSSIPDGLNFHRTPIYQGARCATQVDWTAEREAFFARMGAGMERMILELVELFKTPDQVAQIAQSNGNLMLTGGAS